MCDDLQNYRKKVNHYLIEHKDQMTIYKLNHNTPITAQDMKMLEDILWKELGTREDNEKDFGVTPITNLVRQIVGLNSKAANEALSWVIRP